jgi:hypothetical protein
VVGVGETVKSLLIGAEIVPAGESLYILFITKVV